MRILAPPLGFLLLLAACGGGSSPSALSATGSGETTSLSAGQGQEGRGQNGDRPHTPPHAALDACAALADGDACAFTGRGGDTVEGSCVSRNDTLACRPLHRPGPPQEAVDACAGQGDGASCAFTSPRGDAVTGSCITFNGNRACKPDRAPRAQP